MPLRSSILGLALVGLAAGGCEARDQPPWGAAEPHTVVARMGDTGGRMPLALPVQPVTTGASPTPSIDASDVPKDLPAGYIDTSAAAQQSFFTWEDYELPSPDLGRGAQVDYHAGTTTCQLRSQGLLPTDVVHYLVAESGFHGAAAEAVVASALRALCIAADTGYRTAFDMNVDQFESAVLTLLTFDPPNRPVYEFGFFLKETCAAMTTPGIGGPGIYDHTVALTQSGYFALSQGADTDVINVLINEAVVAGCPAVYDLLPPIIQASS